MADTHAFYNQAAKVFANQEITIASIKVMLLNGATFTAANTNVSSVSGSQVSGNGWTLGGEALTTPAVTTVTTNDAKLDATDISVTASGGSIGPADGAALYDDAHASDALLSYITFGSSQTATVGNTFDITWNVGGIYTWTVT